MVGRSVAESVDKHVILEIEGIDRMYLKGYVPSLQSGGGFVHVVRDQLDCQVPSTLMIAPMSRNFMDAIERLVEQQALDLVSFTKGQGKDDVAQGYLAEFKGQEGVPFIGKAQEKASVFRMGSAPMPPV